MAHRQMTAASDVLCEKTKKRRVGALDDKAVYFIGGRMGFHLALEISPGQIRRLSEMEHLRFKKQSRREGLCYGKSWEVETQGPSDGLIGSWDPKGEPGDRKALEEKV